MHGLPAENATWKPLFSPPPINEDSVLPTPSMEIGLLQHEYPRTPRLTSQNILLQVAHGVEAAVCPTHTTGSGRPARSTNTAPHQREDVVDEGLAADHHTVQEVTGAAEQHIHLTESSTFSENTLHTFPRNPGPPSAVVAFIMLSAGKKRHAVVTQNPYSITNLLDCSLVIHARLKTRSRFTTRDTQ